jgi:transaldolase / glucose-6-phosphate isomerase
MPIAIRLSLRDSFHAATTVGFGPRYLHSTGQIHKGGPNTGIFHSARAAACARGALEIPGREYSFGALNHAQAAGDLETLASKGRRVLPSTLDQLEELIT